MLPIDRIARKRNRKPPQEEDDLGVGYVVTCSVAFALVGLFVVFFVPPGY